MLQSLRQERQLDHWAVLNTLLALARKGNLMRLFGTKRTYDVARHNWPLLAIFPLFIPLAQWGLRSKGAQLALFFTSLVLAEYMLAGFSLRWLLA